MEKSITEANIRTTKKKREEGEEKEKGKEEEEKKEDKEEEVTLLLQIHNAFSILVPNTLAVFFMRRGDQESVVSYQQSSPPAQVPFVPTVLVSFPRYGKHKKH